MFSPVSTAEMDEASWPEQTPKKVSAHQHKGTKEKPKCDTRLAWSANSTPTVSPEPSTETVHMWFRVITLSTFTVSRVHSPTGFSRDYYTLIQFGWGRPYPHRNKASEEYGGGRVSASRILGAWGKTISDVAA